MQCEKIKEIITTELWDKTADLSLKRNVDEHLASCAECQAYFKAMSSLTAELKKAPLVHPPQNLWAKINEKIAERSIKKNLVQGSILERWGMVLRSHLGWSYAFGLTLLVLSLAGVFQLQKTKSVPVQTEIVSSAEETKDSVQNYLISENSSLIEIHETSFGTAAEEFFLS